MLEAIVTRQARSGANWQVIGWDAWDNAGESQNLAGHAAIQPAEGREAFLRLLGADAGANTVVSVFDLHDRINTWVRMDATPAPSDGVAHPRPNLSTIFVAPGTETEKALADIWASQLGLSTVGIHDRFFDLGGHSLLAVQMSAEIRNRFGVDMPVLETFEAPTVAELSVRIDDLRAGVDRTEQQPTTPAPDPSITSIDGQLDTGASPGEAAKARYRTFYDDVSRRLAATGVGSSSFFLNYGYVSVGDGDEAVVEVPDGEFNPNSIRLALELVGADRFERLPDGGRRLRSRWDSDATGQSVRGQRGGSGPVARGHRVLSPDSRPSDRALRSRRRREPSSRRRLVSRGHQRGVVPHLPGSAGLFVRGSAGAAARRLVPPHRPAADGSLAGGQSDTRQSGTGDTRRPRDNRRACWRLAIEISLGRAKVFGTRTADLDNFLAVPGSPVYEQMRSGSWEYRIMRSQLPPAATVRQASEEDSP